MQPELININPELRPTEFKDSDGMVLPVYDIDRESTGGLIQTELMRGGYIVLGPSHVLALKSALAESNGHFRDIEDLLFRAHTSNNLDPKEQPLQRQLPFCIVRYDKLVVSDSVESQIKAEDLYLRIHEDDLIDLLRVNFQDVERIDAYLSRVIGPELEEYVPFLEKYAITRNFFPLFANLQEDMDLRAVVLGDLIDAGMNVDQIDVITAHVDQKLTEAMAAAAQVFPADAERTGEVNKARYDFVVAQIAESLWHHNQIQIAPDVDENILGFFSRYKYCRDRFRLAWHFIEALKQESLQTSPKNFIWLIEHYKKEVSPESLESISHQVSMLTDLTNKSKNTIRFLDKLLNSGVLEYLKSSKVITGTDEVIAKAEDVRNKLSERYLTEVDGQVVDRPYLAEARDIQVHMVARLNDPR